MPVIHHKILTAMALLSTAAIAQQFDQILLDTGATIRGRVIRAFEPDHVLIHTPTARREIPRTSIVEVTTLLDHARSFFGRIDRHRTNPKFREILIEWAESKGLTGLARALAIETVFARAPLDKSRAHRLLGNVLVRDTWRWPLGDRFVSQKAYLAYHADMGHPFVLEGKHFTVQTSAHPVQAARTLLDLEYLYLYWMDRFGKSFRMRESVVPMNFYLWPDRASMPKRGKHAVGHHEVG